MAVVHAAAGREFASKTNGVGFFLFPSIQLEDHNLAVRSVGMDTMEGRFDTPGRPSRGGDRCRFRCEKLNTLEAVQIQQSELDYHTTSAYGYYTGLSSS